MKSSLKRWLPIALCCLPGIALAVAIGVGLSASGVAVAGWLGSGLRVLPIVACPVAMGLMMWWMSRDTGHQGSEHQPQSAADQLAAIRIQAQALEAQVAAQKRAALDVRPAANERGGVPARLR